jgi:hypothetical protein
LETNLYAPPVATVIDLPRASNARVPEFYVVSRTKFVVLFFATFGAYQLYWFYKHWARYRRRSGEDLSPVWRTIFAIFYTHSLGNEVDHSLARAGIAHRWAPGALAAGYVLFQIGGTICDRLSVRDIGSPVTDILGLLSLLPIGYCLWGIQNAANIACGQPQGESNRTFTWANWVWIALGALWWLIALLGLVLLYGVGTE